jgi:integrase
MTGCRRGEALGLTWRDLDIEGGRVAIRRALVPIDGRLCETEPNGCPENAKNVRLPCAAASIEYLRVGIMQLRQNSAVHVGPLKDVNVRLLLGSGEYV